MTHEFEPNLSELGTLGRGRRHPRRLHAPAKDGPGSGAAARIALDCALPRSQSDGSLDEARPGVPRKIDDAKVESVIVQALGSQPSTATHWSTRSMARHSGISTSRRRAPVRSTSCRRAVNATRRRGVVRVFSGAFEDCRRTAAVATEIPKRSPCDRENAVVNGKIERPSIDTSDTVTRWMNQYRSSGSHLHQRAMTSRQSRRARLYVDRG
jgi:hypothetical protein